MLGLDADQSKAGEVGKDGLSISGVRKMQVLFKDIDLDKSANKYFLWFFCFANYTSFYSLRK